MKSVIFISVTSAGLLCACATTKTTIDSDYFASKPAHNYPYNAPMPRLPKAVNQAYKIGGQPYHNNAAETSLWNSSPKSLFGDRRASQTGDILTVVIEIDDEAEFRNSVTESRQSDQNFGVGAFFGIPELINRNLPDGASMSPAVDISKTNDVNGNGNIRRNEKLTLRLAAQVTNVMPNGYMHVSGQQQIVVNNEARLLQINGLIRAQDISRLNTITYDKMADARIYYGGEGNLTDMVKPKAGQKVLNTILPF